MTASKQISLGSLVTPIEDRAGRFEYVFDRSSPKGRRQFIWTGAIALCETPNRERPLRSSSDMAIETFGVVIGFNDGRYRMLQLLTVDANGTPKIGWVLEADVEVVS